ncbi:hypothetical protein D3C81_1151900 [compost metagenome]
MFKFTCEVEYSNDELNIEHNRIEELKEFKTYEKALVYMYRKYNMEYMVETEDYWTTEWECSEDFEFERTVLKIIEG